MSPLLLLLPPWPETTLPTWLAVFVAVLLLSRRLFFGGRLPPLPPGPWGLPLVGFLPFLGKEFHRTLQGLAATYGPVYQIFLGSKRVVVISDPKLVRRAFSQAAFSGRPDTELTKLLQGYGEDPRLWRWFVRPPDVGLTDCVHLPSRVAAET